MTPRAVAGIDLALVKTGIATPAGQVLIDSTGTTGVDRWRYVRDGVLGAAAGCSDIVIEGYSYGSRGSSTLDLAELGGIVRLALAERGHRVYQVPPTTVKQWATGHGLCPKKAMVKQARDELGYLGAQPDIADALWLRDIGLHLFGDPAQRPLTPDRAAVLRSITKGKRP